MSVGGFLDQGYSEGAVAEYDQLHLFLEHFDLPLIVIRRSGAFESANRTGCALLGGEPAPGTPIAQMLTSTGWDLLSARLGPAETPGAGAGNQVVPLQWPKGPEQLGPIPFEVHLSPEGSPDARVKLIGRLPCSLPAVRQREIESLRQINQFSRKLAHRLNNSLAIVSWFSGLLKMSLEPDGEQEEYLARVREGYEDAAGLLALLFEIEPAQLSELSVVDLSSCLEEVIDVVNQEHRSSGVSLRFESSRRPAKALSYLAPLRFTLRRILTAAIASLEQGTQVEVFLRLLGAEQLPFASSCWTAERCYWMIEVRPRGRREKPAASWRRDFEPFNVLVAQSHEMALRLYLAQRVARASFGELLVEGTQEGDVFNLFLPAVLP